MWLQVEILAGVLPFPVKYITSVDGISQKMPRLRSGKGLHGPPAVLCNVVKSPSVLVEDYPTSGGQVLHYDPSPFSSIAQPRHSPRQGQSPQCHAFYEDE